MNTKNKKNQRQRTRQRLEPKKQGQNHSMFHDDRKRHEQELPETRLTR